MSHAAAGCSYVNRCWLLLCHTLLLLAVAMPHTAVSILHFEKYTPFNVFVHLPAPPDTVCKECDPPDIVCAQNVIGYLGCFQVGRALYVAMEYAPGGDLEQRWLAARKEKAS